ncbi:integrase [Gordonia terrae]|uniref:Integrase n=1 Tax=Gordonia terrae TaxID=2055 RepID=A0A2I1R358_9ACTN|nr:site-specific integrase [Gordonia terrae]PKZ63539.1 integrase [Gordonia terrae]PZU02841.1 MAG: site-specific integrase [Gordonia sp. (in: high G+C Gram-positive bacteria)]
MHRYGDLSSASMPTIVALATSVWPEPIHRRRSRNRGLDKIGDYLCKYSGDTWQERWDICELNIQLLTAGDAAPTGTTSARAEFTQGIEALFALRVIRPTLRAFRANKLLCYSHEFAQAEGDPALDSFITAVDETDASDRFKRWAVFDVCTALTYQGIPFADLTPEAFMDYAVRAREGTGRTGMHLGKYVGHLAWQVLHGCGHFQASAPPTLRAALRAPQLTTTEMVDQYSVRNQSVRRLLIDYLDRRGTEVDYATLSGQAHLITKLFWVAVEQLNPEQTDLHISQEVYARWRARITVCEDGSPRTDQAVILSAVRTMYFDINVWATNEPEKWAHWAAPCPVPRSDIRMLMNHKHRVRERTHATIRTLQPLLPALIDALETRHEKWHTLLDTASKIDDQQQFNVGDRTYTRIYSREDRRLVALGAAPRVRVHDHQAGKSIDVNRQEDAAFWGWAIVETLRHSGLRIEELTELSHLSVRQYRRPNGEVIALLVVAPSKTDRERVIPMSAELFHVIACIIRRITAGKSTVPLATRYDDHERITSDPQPFLFQRRIGQRIEVMTTGAIGTHLRNVCADIATTDPRFDGIHFRPHDFRRLFATELVNNGLPIHIGAALLGHLDLETTRGYVAVFNEDVTRHYQAHLQRRRALRPPEEYPPVTNDDWAEFEAHFDKRKVELGGCGRPYATPCSHEHACIRCPMLHVDPKMLPRLDDIETSLLERRDRAHTENWLGEIEGIDLTLSFLRGKRTEVQRRLRRHTDLGLPTTANPPARSAAPPRPSVG